MFQHLRQGRSIMNNDDKIECCMGDAHSNTRMSGEERRAQLLNAAAAIFARKGFAGTTTREIANFANVTEALIFKHFDGKEQLFEAILNEQKFDDEYYRLHDSLKDAIRDRNDKKVFEDLVKLILHKHRSNKDIYRMVLFSILENRLFTIQLLKKQMTPVFEMIADYIRDRVAEGKFACNDPEIYVIALIGMASHQAMMGELFTDTRMIPDDAVATEAYTNIILDGITLRKDH